MIEAKSQEERLAKMFLGSSNVIIGELTGLQESNIKAVCEHFVHHKTLTIFNLLISSQDCAHGAQEKLTRSGASASERLLKIEFFIGILDGKLNIINYKY